MKTTTAAQRAALSFLALLVACLFACGQPGEKGAPDGGLVGSAYPVATLLASPTGTVTSTASTLSFSQASTIQTTAGALTLGGGSLGVNMNGNPVQLQVAGSNVGYLAQGSGDYLYLGASGSQLSVAPTGVSILGTGASGAAGASIGITPQAPNATGNSSGGNIKLNLSAPSNSGSEASIALYRGASAVSHWGPYSSAFTAMWFGTATPSTTNYSFLGANDGSATYLNVPNSTGTLTFAFGGSAAGTWTSSSGLELFGTPGWGGGQGVLAIANATTAPTSNPSGGGVAYASGGALAWRGSGGWTTEVAAAGTVTSNTQLETEYRRTNVFRSTSTGAVALFTSPSLTASHVMLVDAIVEAIDTTALGSSAVARIACSYANSAGTMTSLGSTVVYNHHFTTPPNCSTSGTTIQVDVNANTTDATDWQVIARAIVD